MQRTRFRAVMGTMVIVCASSVAGVALPGCEATHNVPLLARGLPVTFTPARSMPLEVVTRATAVKDPLPVSGADVAYEDVETSMGIAVSTAAAPWADAHREKRPGGWQMLVEVIQAEAEEDDGERLLVTLGVRATLRARDGNQYLAQTQASCRESGLVRAQDGQPVVARCMEHVGRDLAGWLGSVEP